MATEGEKYSSNGTLQWASNPNQGRGRANNQNPNRQQQIMVGTAAPHQVTAPQGKVLSYVRFAHRAQCTIYLCDNCFGQFHIAKGCMLPSNCTVLNCRRKHHTLLHRHQSEYLSTVCQNGPAVSAQTSTQGHSGNPTNTSAQQGTTYATGAGTSTYATGAGRSQVILKVLPVKIWVSSSNRFIETYALLDNCSDVTLCTEALAAQLGLSGNAVTYSLTTVNESGRQHQGMEVSFDVFSIDGKDSVSINGAWTTDRIDVSRHSIPRREMIENWPHLVDIHIPEIEPKTVQLLIGGDVPEVFWSLEERHRGKDEPYAVRNKLGWTLMGPVCSRADTKRNVHFTRAGNDSDSILLQQVQKMWEVDFNDAKSLQREEMSVQDKQALSIMEETICKTPDGHYQLAMPWKLNVSHLRNNRSMVENRMKSLAKRFQRDPELQVKYTAVVEDNINKGFASKIPDDEIQSISPVFYLPHHPVFNPRKPGKLRVVYDCAAKYAGRSLNDQLLRGPDFVNQLIGVLIRFRQHPIALMADIEAMFNQVRVSVPDRDYLRFLWWPQGDISTPCEEFRMNVHLFGAKSSPSCASYCLRRTAEDHETEYDPDVINTVRRNFYVDDCLTSMRSVDSAVRVANQVTKLLSEGGFRLTKWVSNSTDVLKTIPAAERAASVDLDLDNSSGLPIEGTLGIKWNVELDSLQFSMHYNEKPATRRGILSSPKRALYIASLVSNPTTTEPTTEPVVCESASEWLMTLQ